MVQESLGLHPGRCNSPVPAQRGWLEPTAMRDPQALMRPPVGAVCDRNIHRRLEQDLVRRPTVRPILAVHYRCQPPPASQPHPQGWPIAARPHPDHWAKPIPRPPGPGLDWLVPNLAHPSDSTPVSAGLPPNVSSEIPDDTRSSLGSSGGSRGSGGCRSNGGARLARRRSGR